MIDKENQTQQDQETDKQVSEKTMNNLALQLAEVSVNNAMLKAKLEVIIELYNNVVKQNESQENRAEPLGEKETPSNVMPINNS